MLSWQRILCLFSELYSFVTSQAINVFYVRQSHNYVRRLPVIDIFTISRGCQGLMCVIINNMVSWWLILHRHPVDSSQFCVHFMYAVEKHAVIFNIASPHLQLCSSLDSRTQSNIECKPVRVLLNVVWIVASHSWRRYHSVNGGNVLLGPELQTGVQQSINLFLQLRVIW